MNRNIIPLLLGSSKVQSSLVVTILFVSLGCTSLGAQTTPPACDCTDYLYLNDISDQQAGNGKIYKWEVDPATGDLTEITQSGGAQWMTGLESPHGIGTDLNGDIYFGDSSGGPIYKVDCAGGTLVDDATLFDDTRIQWDLYNIGSYNGLIFANGGGPDAARNVISVFDPCGDFLGEVCLNFPDNSVPDWGMEVQNDGTILASTGGFGDSPSALFRFQFTEDMIDGDCVDPIVTGGFLDDYASIYGVTSDGTHLYVLATANQFTDAYLLKVNIATGNLDAVVQESDDPLAGWDDALGIVYLESVDILYIAGRADCISLVDPSDLSYIKGFGTVGPNDLPKGIAFVTECCPSTTPIVVNESLCIDDMPGKVFLQDLINCDGAICEGGSWIETVASPNIDFESCDNSFMITGEGGCATFTLSSDGMGSTSQCGEFTITVNVCAECTVMPAAGLTLGSTIFLDNNNDGLQNGADTGIANVEVQLWDASTNMQVLTDANGMLVTDPTMAATVLTDADGNYLFSNLPEGDYYVVLPTAPAAAPISSNDASSGFVETDPDDNTDNDDEGLQPGGTGTAVSSNTITLVAGEEPENEPAQGGGQDTISANGFTDNNGNMTLDFGFFASVTVGDTAFVDLNNDGLQSMGEPGVENVMVTIYDNATGMPVDFDAEGAPYTSVTTTGPNGDYLFENLPPGEYYVVFDISTVADAAFYTFTTNDVDGDVSDEDDSDANPANGQTPATDFIPAGGEDLSLDVGIACNVTAVVAEPAAICSTQPIDLTQGASITPATLGGTWSSSGDGLFAAGTDFATATTYTPGPADIALGMLVLTLTTADPAGPCDPVSATVTFLILKADCGTFFWDGSND